MMMDVFGCLLALLAMGTNMTPGRAAAVYSDIKAAKYCKVL